MPGRVRFEHGQRLSARDLEAAVGAELASGGRHVVGAHNTWGIALGLEARLRGGREIVVRRGVAYDAWGRTLVVPVPVAVRLDVPTDDAVVVARWESGAVAVRALAPTDVRPGRDVPLAALTNGASGLDDGVRRCARTRATPRIGAGSITASLVFSQTVNVREIQVVTSGAGFVDTPSYAVSAVGHVALADRLGPLVSIAEPDPAGFMVQVRYAQRPGGTAVGRTIEMRLDWLGVEPRRGCPLPTLPALSPFTRFERGPA